MAKQRIHNNKGKELARARGGNHRGKMGSRVIMDKKSKSKHRRAYRPLLDELEGRESCWC